MTSLLWLFDGGMGGGGGGGGGIHPIQPFIHTFEIETILNVPPFKWRSHPQIVAPQFESNVHPQYFEITPP
jgi:hypothetical protein